MRKIKKLAIANRGEVAVRMIRACQELDISTVLLHSEVDKRTLAYRLADECVCIGPAESHESYLNISRTLLGAQSCGADALHPGFGFLSENSEFAQACENAGILFVGPRPENIQLLGDKMAAKERVARTGIPTLPSYRGDVQESSALLKEAEKLGFPVIVKAAAGGGGRGMKILRGASDEVAIIDSAKREALSSFGSSKIFLEKYLESAKHIEVQIFVDGVGQPFHLFERECSVQRRHQKVIEEAPSGFLGDELRVRICEQAARLGQETNYRGAGTVEFLVQDNQHYFLEMNTRLQVEHPVTESILGIDLVKEQIRTAQGEPCFWRQSALQPRGHAIECRINAEDEKGFPSLGTLGFTQWPMGPGRRFDIGFEEGDEVTSFYDSMIGKVIVWDETRNRAIQKMLRTLDETIIFGIKTNIPFLKAILSHPSFTDCTMTTRFLEQNFPHGLESRPLTEKLNALAELTYPMITDSATTLNGTTSESGSLSKAWFLS